MTPYDAARDRSPWGQVGRWPIQAATLLVAVHVAAMVVVTLLTAAHIGLTALPFQRETVLRGEVWRLVSDALQAFGQLAGEGEVSLMHLWPQITRGLQGRGEQRVAFHDGQVGSMQLA